MYLNIYKIIGLLLGDANLNMGFRSMQIIGISGQIYKFK